MLLSVVVVVVVVLLIFPMLLLLLLATFAKLLSLWFRCHRRSLFKLLVVVAGFAVAFSVAVAVFY